MNIVTGCALTALLTLGTCTSELRPAPPPNDTFIVFCSDRESGVFRLFRMDADGRNARALIPDRSKPVAEHRNPSVSPDGRRVVFERIDSAGASLCVFDLGSADEPTVVADSAGASQPAWSPDGTRVAYRHATGGIHVCAIDGTEHVRLSPASAQDRWPQWSPDGTRLAFSSIRDGRENLWVMDANGSNRTRVTNTDARDSRPSWSENGQALTFHSTSKDSGKHDSILRIGVDGRGRSDVHGGSSLRDAYVDRNLASWGARVRKDSVILFQSLRTGNAEIYRMNADGSNVTQLTSDNAQDDMACWAQ